MKFGGKLASRAVFAARLWANGIRALSVVVVSLAVGMAGYMWFGRMGLAEGFANAAMILSGMGPLSQLATAGGQIFEGLYALVCGLVFFAVAGLVLAPMLHRLLHRFHLEDTAEGPEKNLRG
jgi:hypothetical protein